MRPVRTTFYSNRYPSPSWNKQVFQLFPAKGNVVSVQEAREIYDLCSTFTDEKSKEAMYLMNGMDGRAVDKYLHVVERLYLCYHMPSYKKNTVIEKETEKKNIVYKEIPTVSWIDLVKLWVNNWTYHQLRRKYLL